jgi:hypothetical protein
VSEVVSGDQVDAKHPHELILCINLNGAESEILDYRRLAQAQRAKAAFTMIPGILALIFIRNCVRNSGRNTGGNTDEKTGGKSGENPANNPDDKPGSNPSNKPEFLFETLSFFHVYNRRVLPASLLTRAVAGFPEDFHEGSS